MSEALLDSQREAPPAEGQAVPTPRKAPRHRLSTRIWHWTNAVALLILLMSGLSIFNAHPRLYWGKYGADPDPAWLEIGAEQGEGYLRIGAARVETSGLLGLWRDGEGREQRRAFPGWATIPSSYDLAAGRRWHFFFAWIFALGLAAFMIRALWNGHVARDLHLRREEWRPAHLWREIKDHARLRFAKGAEARRYNSLQKISYIKVIFILSPLMIFTGLAMSPAMAGNWEWLLDIFGGRQSARSIHFICAFLLVLFFIIHIVMVLLSGPLFQLRAMVTGRHGETG